MVDKLKVWTEKRLAECKRFAKTKAEVYNYRGMCYGAMTFLGTLPENNINWEELGDWWDIIWAEFQIIADEKRC